uniref:ATP synthase complex subunit 8 n=3 Tax=Carcharhinidae TaxID=7805 RepID=A0A6B9WFP7_RHIAS|nr:ATP synthase F0 subunit 8 [Scoliodon macrorhynchos]YP_009646777.1 ATP synthase F0 subunit 8 [Scoliodon laticaudus]YP_009731105.1 ATP synthase F0 subunit 8 [Rhizoprionodon acutus]AFJ94666.1 ATP synthase F0 subunit 8 [Scoliodon macrorhynchos]AKH02178.1 ATP synthase F0 subunit 8 [Scoliodon laticaudus]QHQ97246.1 ATP synthase F0 subunit 8 [Rhizoprionodon acutus]UVU20670.1 ATP synthase F0 subunit 8 [Scoliodon laticaudus]
MPQLNPNPWFLILLFSWIIFITILPNKVMNHLYNKDFTLKSTEKSKPNPWNWPWL